MTEHAEPASFAFDAESNARIEKILTKYPAGKQASAVLPLLWIAQRQMGRVTGSAWVPVKAMDEIARILSMAPIRVYEVCTFYLMFNTAPVGRFHLQLCTTTPCWLRGSDDVVAACKKHIHPQPQTISSDGKFSWMEVECLGACVNAPMLQIGKDFYEDLDGPKTEQLLTDIRAGKKPKVGPQNGRRASEPEGGPTTLKETV